MAIHRNMLDKMRKDRIAAITERISMELHRQITDNPLLPCFWASIDGEPDESVNAVRKEYEGAGWRVETTPTLIRIYPD